MASAAVGVAREVFKSQAAPLVVTDTFGISAGGIVSHATSSVVIKEGAKWAATALSVANPTLGIALGATGLLAVGAAYAATKLKQDDRLYKNIQDEIKRK